METDRISVCGYRVDGNGDVQPGYFMLETKDGRFPSEPLPAGFFASPGAALAASAPAAIPQNDRGAEVVSLAITPKSTGKKRK